jgi:TRAP-type C4-dicarboxylate transport system permease small subunit
LICQNCGRENAAQASLCTNCGATIAARTLPSPLRLAPSIVLGLLVGVGATALVWFGGSALYGIGRRPNVEFGVSQASAWFYLSALLLTCAALVVLFLRPIVRRLDGRLRALLLVALFVMLGGMSLCNLFSSSALFVKS